MPYQKWYNQHSQRAIKMTFMMEKHGIIKLKGAPCSLLCIHGSAFEVARARVTEEGFMKID